MIRGASWLSNYPSNQLADILGWTNVSSDVINEQTAIQITAVNKCLTVIGDGIAQMSLKLFEKTDQGRKEVEYTLLSDPNPYQTGYEFRKYMTIRAAYTGNALAYIFRNSSYEPISLLPITCDYKQKLINGELYYVMTNNDLVQGLPKVVHSNDILHLKGLCVDNYFGGVNPIKAHARSLRVNTRAYSALDNTFKSGTKKFALSGGDGKHWDVPQQKYVQESIEKLLNNEKSTVAVPAGVSIQEVSLTPSEAGYLSAIKASEHDIALIFNVPSSMIVRESGAIRATVEQDALSFQNQTLLPLATQWEQEYKRKLIPERVKPIRYFKHNFNSLLRASSKERMEVYKGMINNGIMSPNEARKLEDLDGYDGGDKRFINAANIPVDQFEEWIEAKINNLNKSKMNNNPEGENNNEQ